jgi:hypothetical protein
MPRQVMPLMGGVAGTPAGDASCCVRWGSDGFGYDMGFPAATPIARCGVARHPYQGP